MAKVSQVNRNKMRERMAGRDKGKRKALKDIVMDRTLPVEDRFNASLKLAQLPRNGAKVRVRLRCEITGRRGAITANSSCAVSRCATSPVPGRSPAWSRPAGKKGTGPPCHSPIPGRYAHSDSQRAACTSLDVHVAGLAVKSQRARRVEARGFIRGYSSEELRPGVARLKIELKYNEGEPVIKDITRVSRPGRRVYSKIKELPRVYAGLGISILSTPRGVMSDAEARAANVGGEVLCRVF